LSFHPKTLGLSQRRVLRKLGPVATAQGFHLGGGTALAIHLGHRRSVDFDWFIEKMPAGPLELAGVLKAAGLDLKTSDVQRGTLHGTVAGVRVSFIEYPYPPVAQLVEWPAYGCRLASLADIACMKLSAIAQRGAKKDFFDIYALCTRFIPLAELLAIYRIRYRVKEIGHVIYGLSYFDDAERERPPVMLWKLDWTTVKKSISAWVAALR